MYYFPGHYCIFSCYTLEILRFGFIFFYIHQILTRNHPRAIACKLVLKNWHRFISYLLLETSNMSCYPFCLHLCIFLCDQLTLLFILGFYLDCPHMLCNQSKLGSEAKILFETSILTFFDSDTPFTLALVDWRLTCQRPTTRANHTLANQTNPEVRLKINFAL